MQVEVVEMEVGVAGACASLRTCGAPRGAPSPSVATLNYHLTQQASRSCSRKRPIHLVNSTRG
jgi:hypothetical protein